MASEADGFAVVMVELSASTSQNVSVTFSTIDNTAVAGSDYTPIATSLTFSPGDTLIPVNIPILSDGIDEPDKTVTLNLSNASSNATLGSPNPAILTIKDSDNPPLVYFKASAYSVVEDKGPALITITLNIASDFPVTVNYLTGDGTAKAPGDYAAQSGSITIPAGQTEGFFTVPITADMFYELDETVALTLTAPIKASLGIPPSATLTISNDDNRPMVQYDRPLYTVLESGGLALITTTISYTPTLTATVAYTTTQLTASPGSDYIPTTGTLAFTPQGPTTLTYTVTILDDPIREPEELILLSLGSPQNANLGQLTATLSLTDPTDVGGCPGPISADEPTIFKSSDPPASPGRPNNIFARVECGSAIVVDLGVGNSINTNTPDPYFDFVYYERGQPNPPTTTTFIYLDWVIVEVAPQLSGPWYQVFYWGDTITDTNTNIGRAGIGPGGGTEMDNRVVNNTTVLSGTTPYTTGIAIDIDNVPSPVMPVPPGIYRYIRFYAPAYDPGNDPVHVDAIEILP
jgi:hypothetical protein